MFSALCRRPRRQFGQFSVSAVPRKGADMGHTRLRTQLLPADCCKTAKTYLHYAFLCSLSLSVYVSPQPRAQ